MSLFSTVKAVMDGNGWPAPTISVASSQDQNMRQCFALCNQVLQSISFKKDWPELIREHEFDTIANQREYDLPADFHHMVAPSAFNANQYYQIKGSLTPIQWWRRSITGAPDFGDSYRVDAFNGKINIAPTPSAPERLVFMYITKNIAKNATGDPIDRYSQDTDTSVIDEEMVRLGLSWRWRQKKGLDFTAEMAEFSNAMKHRFAQYSNFGEINVGGRVGAVWPLTDGNVPDHFGP